MNFVQRIYARNIALLIFTCLPFVQCNAQKTDKSISFSFSLIKTASTSAGVYMQDGTLIKTLWSGEKYEAGKHTANWDGTDDTDQPVPKGAYQVKVLSSNVKYNWEGIIGNTSAEFSGPNVYHAIQNIHKIAIWGNTAYFVTGYNEQNASTYKFHTDDPQRSIRILDKGIYGAFVATDGKNVYWGGCDANVGSSWFVYATRNSDDSEVDFDKGQVVKTKHARTYKSAIDVYSDINSGISGMAVQQKGPYLFVAHKKLNVIDIIDKTTGALVKALPFDSPGSIAIDGNDNLWMVSASNDKPLVSKFKINANGSLAATNVSIPNLKRPLAFAVSPDNSTIAVIDGDDSQQVKAFDAKTGNFKWIFGKEHGYASDPDVRDDKFYFTDAAGKGTGTTIAFGQDGSFWVEDSGNSRLQHYSADRKFINRVMSLPSSYATGVDPNNPERVFSDYLEFKVDYSKPLRPDNGSWTLVKNWGYDLPAEYIDRYKGLHSVATLSNGRTYFVVSSRKQKKDLIAELPAKGPVRITKSWIKQDGTQFYPDGSLRKKSLVRMAKPVTWTERRLVSFDNQNDPVWGDEQVIATMPVAIDTDPLKSANGILNHAADITSSGILVIYDNVRTAVDAPNWHLGGIRIGDNKWLWRTAAGTSPANKGPFPAKGLYDNRKVNHGGSVSLIADKNIFWGYYGEGWAGGEVNKWNHVYDDGLFIGQFGVAGSEIPHTEAPAMMAGNAFSAVVVKDKNGNAYLYHNDESQHGGIHRWKISDLNTIQEQTIPVKL